MDEFWTGVLVGVVAAVLSALIIGLLNRLVVGLTPFPVVIGSVLIGFVLLGLAWFLNSSEVFIAAVATVVTGLLGAWYLALPARDRSDTRQL